MLIRTVLQGCQQDYPFCTRLYISFRVRVCIYQPITRTFVFRFLAEPHSSVGSVSDLRTGGRWLDPIIFFPRIYDSHCDRIYSSLIAVRCFVDGYVVKHPVAWKEYCVEYWLKELQESLDRRTGFRDIT